MNDTEDITSGLTAQHTFDGFETVDPTDHGIILWRHLVSSPVKLPDELKRETETKRNDIVKQCQELAARETKYTYDGNIGMQIIGSRRRA